MEVWKNIEGYPNYMVSNLGNVKSLNYNHTKKERILKKDKRGGYYYNSLQKNGISKKFNIHQLVAMAFLNHIPKETGLVVNHINFNKLDNRLENLEIVTIRENSNKNHLKSTSKYVGVSWHKCTKKWQARIFINNKSKYIGIFDSEIEASNAYQNALKNLT